MVNDGTSGNSANVVAVAKPQRKPDVRNLEWKKANVGSKLLSKMGGWQEGQAIGKRQRQRDEVSDGQGLRVMKRPDGWGIGHDSTATNAAAAAALPHVNDFTNVLASLRRQHTPDPHDVNVDTKESETIESSNSLDERKRPRKKKRLSTDEPPRKKSKKAKPSLSTTTTKAILPRNRMTHAKVRAAKFQPRTDADWIGIFGTTTH
jgi:hypothetical protein